MLNVFFTGPFLLAQNPGCSRFRTLRYLHYGQEAATAPPPSASLVRLTGCRFLMLALENLFLTNLPQSHDVLHQKAYGSDTYPAACSHDQWFSAGFYKLDDVCVEADCSHCKDDEKF